MIPNGFLDGRFIIVNMLEPTWVHQENDMLSDLSDLSCTRHLRQNQTDLMDLAGAVYLLVQGTNA